MIPKISSVGLVCRTSPQSNLSSFVSQKKSLKLMSRASQLCIAATKLATQSLEKEHLENAALFVGVGMSGGELDALSSMLSVSLLPDGTLDWKAMGEHGLSRINPLLSFLVLNNMPLCHVSIEFGIRGPHGAFYVEGAAAGFRVLAKAAQRIEQGESRVALAGGTDSLLDTINLSLSLQKDPSEGSAMLVFSSEGDIAWLGLSEAHPTQEKALQALTQNTPVIQLNADDSEPFGSTQAASASLWVARAVQSLREFSVGAEAVIFAKNERGFSALLLSRCQ